MKKSNVSNIKNKITMQESGKSFEIINENIVLNEQKFMKDDIISSNKKCIFISRIDQKKLLLIIVAMFWFAQYVYIPYQTPYLLSIGVATSLAGTVVGAYGLSQLLFRMPVGLMADKKGRHKPFIMIGVISAGLASLFRIFIPNGIGFLIASLFSGLASAMWISFMVLYSNYFKNNELQKSTGTIIAANNIGIFIGFMAGTIFYDSMGMKFLCALSTLISILATMLSLLIREPKIDFKPVALGELIKVYLDKRLILFSLFSLIQQGILMSTCMSFTTQVAKQLGASGLEIGICSIIYILFAVLSSYFAASKFAIKYGGKLWIPIVFLCLLIYCIAIPNLSSVEQIYIAQVLAGITTGVLFSFCTSEAMKNVPPQKKSTAMGYYQAIYAIGMTLMPILTGAIADSTSMKFGFYLLGIMSLIGALGSIIFYRLKNK